MLPPVGIESRHPDFHVLYTTIWANSPICRHLSPLDPYVDMLYWFQKILSPRINKEWLHKDLKDWDFQQIGEFAQAVACRTWKSEVPGFNSYWG